MGCLIVRIKKGLLRFVLLVFLSDLIGIDTAARASGKRPIPAPFLPPIIPPSIAPPSALPPSVSLSRCFCQKLRCCAFLRYSANHL
jgi:hypothetical protein